MKYRKFLALTLSVCSVVGCIPVYAGVDGTETFTEEQTTDVGVGYDLPLDYTVTVPKYVTLDDVEKEVEYEINVRGDIPSNVQIVVEPLDMVDDETGVNFMMSEITDGEALVPKDDVIAHITQRDVRWGREEVTATNGTSKIGKIFSTDLSVGSWGGNFEFSIRAVNTGVQAVVEDEDGYKNNITTIALDGAYEQGIIDQLVYHGIVDEAKDADLVLNILGVDDTAGLTDAEFNINDSAKVGDTVVFVTYNEEENKWIYLGIGVVGDDKKITFDFTQSEDLVLARTDVDGIVHEHHYQETVVTPVSCLIDGESKFTCVCNDTYTEYYDPLGHNYVDTTCSRCGDTFSYTDFNITASNYSQMGVLNQGHMVIPKYFQYGDAWYRTVSIEADAFKNCTALTEVTIPDSVTTIGDNAFYGCTSLAKVNWHDKVTTLGASAFEGCTALESIDIPRQVTRIENNTFHKSGLTSIVIPKNVTYIGAKAFGTVCTTSYNNSASWVKDNVVVPLKSVYFEHQVPPTIESGAFQNGSYIYVSATFPKEYTCKHSSMTFYFKHSSVYDYFNHCTLSTAMTKSSNFDW